MSSMFLLRKEGKMWFSVILEGFWVNLFIALLYIS